jgi:uncharacterized protein YeaO (DUF488 family)
MTRSARIDRRHGLAVKKVRDPVSPADGHRVLVDRLWPRGVSKDSARLSEWARDLSPSDELRRWFGHDPARWDEFKQRYRKELDDRAQLSAIRELRDRARREKVTLVFGASDREHNNAVALRGFIEAL